MDFLTIRLRRIAIRSFSIILIGLVGYGLGIGAGQLRSSRVDEKYRTKRTFQTRYYQAKVDGLMAGDTLPDAHFEDLEFNTITLSDMVHAKSVLMILDPGCYSCIEELELLVQLYPNVSDQRYFAIISSENPRQLMDMKQELNIDSPILYDHNRAFSGQFQIMSFPFNIIVDENLVVERVLAGRLMANEMQDVVQGNNRSSIR